MARGMAMKKKQPTLYAQESALSLFVEAMKTGED
jgi:hypothetical protein